MVADPAPRHVHLMLACDLIRCLSISTYVEVASAVDGRHPAAKSRRLVREPLSAQAAVELAGKLKALSDPVRLRLLSVVASHTGGEACVCDLSVGIEVSQPTISHHLKVLRTAGLLD